MYFKVKGIISPKALAKNIPNFCKKVFVCDLDLYVMPSRKVDAE